MAEGTVTYAAAVVGDVVVEDLAARWEMRIATPLSDRTRAGLPTVTADSELTPANRVVELMRSVTLWPSGRYRVIDVGLTAVTLPRSKV